MRKRGLGLLLCVVVMLSFLPVATMAYAADENGMESLPRMSGDVNGDGKVNQKDVARLRQYIADPDTYPLTAPQNADVNGDNKVNQKDVARLRQYIADPETYPLWEAPDPADPTDPTDPMGNVYYAAVPGITLHEAPNNSAPAITVPYMTAVTLPDGNGVKEGSWNEVQYQGQTYYLWIDKDANLLTSQQSSFTYEAATAIQRRIIDNAMDYLTKPTGYANGASTGEADENGVYWFDCSGFVVHVLEKSMQTEVPSYDLSSVLSKLYQTGDIYNKGYNGEFAATTVIPEGEALDESRLQPGDILFFKVNDESTTKVCNHCGIYMGNGEFIHASSSWGGGVRMMPLKGFYVDAFVAARRYVPDAVTPANQTMYTTSRMTNVYPMEKSDVEPLTTLYIQVPVTLYFTDNGNWAYVEYATGHFGYILTKYLTT